MPTAAIHQPNFLPWLGYFYKIYASDIFIFHDNVQYSKRYYTKRCQIRREKGLAAKTWLTVQIQQHPEKTLIRDIRISYAEDWRSKHVRKIENCYQSAPFFRNYWPSLRETLYEGIEEDHLAEFNISSIRYICDLLGLDRKLNRSSHMNARGEKSAYNLALAKEVGATKYIGGTGAKSYEEISLFKEANITIEHVDFASWHKLNPYPQDQGPWLPGLSVLDALFNLGADGILDYLEKFHAVTKSN